MRFITEEERGNQDKTERGKPFHVVVQTFWSALFCIISKRSVAGNRPLPRSFDIVL
jgi:hypothetical protein